MKRSEIKTGDILLYHSTTFLSRAIQWFEKCPWSHASLAFDIWNQVLISEAERKGLMANDIDYSIGKCKILVLRPKFTIDAIALDKFVALNLGKHGYGFFRLIVIQAIWQLFHRWIIDESKGEKLRRVICGMWAAYVYFKLSNGLYFDTWYRDTPKSLFESDLFDHFELE